jgi:Dyp-type peroxidase family
MPARALAPNQRAADPHAVITDRSERNAMSRAKGVLPDVVIRDFRANAALVFVDLRPDLDAAGLEAWLRAATEIVSRFADDRDEDENRVSSIVTGFGLSFFGSPQSPRFGLTPDQVPFGFREPPDLTPAEQILQHDVVHYVLTLSEAALAEFLQALHATRPLGLVKLTVERGFQRRDRRELFGFRDGLRNPRDEERKAITFIDPELAPNEPDWTEGGTYAAYLKVEQNFDTFRALDETSMAQSMGRTPDGTRLDQPDGTSSKNEGAFSDPAVPPPNAHVRKAGPRIDAAHDAVKVFRRGVPYHEIDGDGAVCAGLQFVSFQWSLDLFNTIYRRWMFNSSFPQPGTGDDALQAQGLMKVRKGGLFFVPPYTWASEGFIGSGLFKEPKPPKPATEGRLVIRKTANDPTVNLAGISFQLLKPDGVTPVGSPFQTNAAGHARSEKLPAGDYLLQETAPATFQAVAPFQVKIDKKATPLAVPNTVAQPGYR